MPIQPQSFISGREQRLHARALRQKFFPPPTFQEASIAAPCEKETLLQEAVFAAAASDVTPIIEDGEIRTPKVAEIQAAVCEVFAVSRLDMVSQRRTADIVKPRQIAMGLCKKLTLRSLPEIGRRFGGRDHTTALHGIRKFQWAIDRIEPDMRDGSSPKDWALAIKALLSSKEITSAKEIQRATRAAHRRQGAINRKAEYLACRLSISFDEAMARILEEKS